MKNLRLARIKIQNTISNFIPLANRNHNPITKTNNGYFPRCPLSLLSLAPMGYRERLFIELRGCSQGWVGWLQHSPAVPVDNFYF